MRRSLTLTAFATLIATAGAANALSAIVPNAPATGAAGVSFAIGDLKASNQLQFRVSDTAFLQTADEPGTGPSYGVNAAGVQTSLGKNPFYFGAVGTGLTDGSSGFTYGALIATLSGSFGTRAVQVFATSAANGVGSATPPSALTFRGTFGSLFGTFAEGPATLSFHVDDTGYADNAGQFVVTQVPEPATWAMLVVGFGLVGASVRRRTTAVTA